MKVLLSFVLIASLLSVCVIQAFAADTRQLNPDDKISEELAQVMAGADDEDLINVALWYENYKCIDSEVEFNKRLERIDLRIIISSC